MAVTVTVTVTDSFRFSLYVSSAVIKIGKSTGPIIFEKESDLNRARLTVRVIVTVTVTRSGS